MVSIKIENGNSFWWLSGVYGPNSYRERGSFWDELVGLNSICWSNQCVSGDLIFHKVGKCQEDMCHYVVTSLFPELLFPPQFLIFVFFNHNRWFLWHFSEKVWYPLQTTRIWRAYFLLGRTLNTVHSSVLEFLGYKELRWSTK